ncbi:unnamed protein product [Hymenolepis diminuta]|uniref:Uncharacterized protein n=1 Tax=Hymenolepis diminuta TaxID=6216 RepID=A0A3P7BSH8_HYMDI|nr:unnamed protein product [Hymenolepis diminuta]
MPSKSFITIAYANSLSNSSQLPAPHHHFTYPLSLPPGSDSEPHPQETPNAPSTSTPTTDLADSSLSFTDGQQSKPRHLSGFNFYNLLRSKVDTIQRLASPATSNAGHSLGVFLELSNA